MLKSNHMQFRNRHITDSEINPVFSEDGHLEKRNGNHPLFFSDEKMSHIDSAVRQFLTEKKPFLKHGYSLRHLSEDIQLPLHHLSAFINRYYHMNFNDFINEYRVHYCKIKIVNDEWKVKKLEAIAEESGFNNRNTFTSAFKKVTGLNPSEYLKGIKEGQKVIEPIFHTTTEHVARA
jgi:AraC-like DNA-binding protein